MRTTGRFGGFLAAVGSGLWLAAAGLVNAQTCYVARAGQTPGEPYDGWGNAAS